ncbi:short-chain fatty acid transporter [Brumimicrobium salinarum]|uniref:Short-chain fatty acid transporter n=1 Tax=Brumimicrobium salinarum TaxID=2058658 RepID=A0A2I0R3G4_9FLAO|nr:TIGR00366 family protein [Brumimicrobium salinarum]PKR81115.1 short-chain fatty acid transporter [Brumimicrobium salinarum]
MNNSEKQSHKAVEIFKRILPSPFTIAILLTILTLLIAQVFTKPSETSHGQYFMQLMLDWEQGLWDDSGGGLYFAFQMMLILVLGHILALTPAVDGLIQRLIKYCTSTSSSVVIVSLGAITMGLLNWGLGLIFGAIIARKVGEKFAFENKAINYGLVGAAGYATMMVWHAGLSGSATTKSMEEGYIPALMQEMDIAGDFPNSIPFEATIGSGLNITMIVSCLIVIPLFLYWLSKKVKSEAVPQFNTTTQKEEKTAKNTLKGAEKLDFSKILGMGLGIGILLVGVFKAFTYTGQSSLGFIQLNFINLMFLGLALTLHQTISNFSKALQEAIGDISGILIQFPFYFGILALMKSSGLIVLFSDGITSVANAYTLPLFTFISAGVVNFFVPSGGGQWAIQGPIIIETVQQLGGSLPKTILAMAYGDQLTNMLQPFWALPLLGITQLKPQQLLPYTFLLFIVGVIIFGIGLLIF